VIKKNYNLKVSYYSVLIILWWIYWICGSRGFKITMEM